MVKYLLKSHGNHPQDAGIWDQACRRLADIVDTDSILFCWSLLLRESDQPCSTAHGRRGSIIHENEVCNLVGNPTGPVDSEDLYDQQFGQHYASCSVVNINHQQTLVGVVSTEQESSIGIRARIQYLRNLGRTGINVQVGMPLSIRTRAKLPSDWVSSPGAAWSD